MKKLGFLPQNEWDGFHWRHRRVQDWRKFVIRATVLLLIIGALLLLIFLIRFLSIHLFYHAGTVEELVLARLDAPVESASLQRFGERGAEFFGYINTATEQEEVDAVLSGLGSLSLRARFPQREISMGAFPDLLILTMWSGEDCVVFRLYPTYDYVQITWNRDGAPRQSIHFDITSALEREEIIALFPPNATEPDDLLAVGFS